MWQSRDLNLCSHSSVAATPGTLLQGGLSPGVGGGGGYEKEVGAWAGLGPWSGARQEQWVLRDGGGPGWGMSRSQGLQG